MFLKTLGIHLIHILSKFVLTFCILLFCLTVNILSLNSTYLCVKKENKRTVSHILFNKAYNIKSLKQETLYI